MRTHKGALLFGYFTREFIRPQWNWHAALSPETQASLDPELRAWLGLDMAANLAGGASRFAGSLSRRS